MSRGRVRTWGALLGVVLVVAACGGDGLSREEFVEQASAICEEHRATIEAEARDVLAGGQVPDPQQFGRLLEETVIPELEQQFEELRELEPPDEVADAYETYLSQGEALVEEMQNDPSALLTRSQQVNQAADEAGLSPACYLGPGGQPAPAPSPS